MESIHRMAERPGQPADDFKTHGLPPFHGAVVAADDEIELHCQLWCGGMK